MSGVLSVAIFTRNERKLAEYRSLLSDVPIRLYSVAELMETIPAVEDADSLPATAGRRAVEACKILGMVTIAEAYGLEVEALGGRPGMRLDSFAHERATDAENNAALLGALEEVEDGERNARFRCVLAMSSPWAGGSVVTVEGCCEGAIARTCRGGGGFGYDPLFVVTELGDCVMAELSDEERSRVSPRARAVRALVPEILAVVRGMFEQANRIAI